MRFYNNRRNVLMWFCIRVIQLNVLTQNSKIPIVNSGSLALVWLHIGFLLSARSSCLKLVFLKRLSRSSYSTYVCLCVTFIKTFHYFFQCVLTVSRRLNQLVWNALPPNERQAWVTFCIIKRTFFSACNSTYASANKHNGQLMHFVTARTTYCTSRFSYVILLPWC